MSKNKPSKKIVILNQRSPYRDDQDHFYVVLSDNHVVKQLILEFSQAVHFGLTLGNKVYYRDEFYEKT